MKKWVIGMLISSVMVLTACAGQSMEEKVGLTYQKDVLETTKYGKVKGYINENENVLIWKGIPYAKAPVKDLRWKNPQNPKRYKGVMDATKDQAVFIQPTQDGVTGSEASLRLNIYRPNTKGKKFTGHGLYTWGETTRVVVQPRLAGSLSSMI
ncbi:carboxylesterase family protein [Listeria fleischmannii]|uniref:carboxylesterase family protein n=1 Tax=Listeria fleischmannii TaxID=1069827 RepID=UPI0020B6E01C|nr:carboxylesterase family protein [Listeria fleischmannii]